MEIVIEGKKYTPTSLERIDFGDTATIYKGVIEGQEYALKLHRDDDLQSRVKRILDKVYKRKQPSALSFRSFPVGSGTAKASEIGREGEDYMAMAFRWVNGRKFSEYIRDNFKNANIELRKRQAESLLEALNFFENCGIVHGDLSIANILVDYSGNLHIIDVESAGLTHRRILNQWMFKPRTFGTKLDGFPISPELKKRSLSPYVDRWAAAQLVAFILTAQIPFAFLKVFDYKSLGELKEIAEDFRKNGKFEYSWPPLGSEDHSNVNTNCNIEVARRDFKKSSPNLPFLIYKTFIFGFDSPKRRPSTQEWLTRLGI
ncbi:MAG: protein kinase family protein [Candidatus Atribacteria bacterium]|nr:protein kinase family protein [Candidatus Atribacteria bacterium]